MKSKMSIAFFGDGWCAVNSLKKILKNEDFEVKCICLRNSHRDQNLQSIGKEHGIDVFWTENVNSRKFIETIKAYQVDLFLSVSFDQIFRKELLSIPPMRAVNCHSGKLPFYRGKCPLIWALINGETEFGITVHYMDEGIDTGDIILQRVFPISDLDDYASVSQRDALETPSIVYDALKVIQLGTCAPRRQDEIDAIGTYCGGRGEGDEIIEWNQPSRRIFNFVRALCHPGPKAVTFRKGDKIFIEKVAEVHGAHEYIGIPGQVVGFGIYGPYIKTGDTMVEIIEYTADGKRICVGDRLGFKGIDSRL